MVKLSCSLILFLPLFITAQMPSDWGAFMQHIDAKPFAGKKFRVEAAVKVQLIDETAEAELWVRVDRTNKQTGFFYNMMDKPIRTPNWTIFTINGKIDKDADHLVFGGLYSRKGVFYFDQFRLFIESGKNKYEEIPLHNAGFESDSLSPWGFLQKRSGFILAPSTDTAYDGKQAMRVDGSNFKKPNTLGNNDSTGKFATVNGISIYYEEYGKGKPLLLLHGNSESIASFKAQIPEFAKDYRVIAADTRGQGKSKEDGKTYSYDLFAEDMNALLDHLQLDSVHVVGWSDGGNTGLIMAMMYPAKVKKLVTMGANVFIDNTVVDKWVFKELNKQLKQLEADSNARAQNRKRLITMLLTEPKHSFEELKGIKCPVLVLAGEKDVIKQDHTKQIAAHITGSTLLIAPKETHEYPRENPAAFNKTVLDFLKR